MVSSSGRVPGRGDGGSQVGWTRPVSPVPTGGTATLQLHLCGRGLGEGSRKQVPKVSGDGESRSSHLARGAEGTGTRLGLVVQADTSPPLAGGPPG